jgi:crotonobetainyl-CoA:carnitine CoA-transferase CaiB-like acyl-CoA transferase
LGAEQLPNPLKVVDGSLPLPEKAPEVGQHTDEVLKEVLGYDDLRITELREGGAFG